jgi:hypothetical protein
VGGVVAPAHFGVVVQLDLKILLGQEVDVGPQDREILVGRVSGEAKLLLPG